MKTNVQRPTLNVQDPTPDSTSPFLLGKTRSMRVA
jgi:hypothetical protein